MIVKSDFKSNSGALVEIKFYSDDKRYLPSFNYRPHFVINGSDYYMGVSFTEFLEAPAFDRNINAKVKFIYDRIDYSSLIVGMQFEVREGAKTVGIGKVIELL